MLYKGNDIAQVKTKISPEDTLFLVDKYLGLDLGTTFKVIKCHCNPQVLNEQLKKNNIPLQFQDFGVLPKQLRNLWKEFVEKLGVDKEYWMDNDLLVPNRAIEILE